MTMQVANNKQPGVKTFYVEGDHGTIYTVQYIRRNHQRRLYCSCADFLYRRLARKRHCKHAKFVAWIIRESHGIRQLATKVA